MPGEGRPLAAAAGERPQMEGVAFLGSCCVVYESSSFSVFSLERQLDGSVGRGQISRLFPCWFLSSSSLLTGLWAWQ